MNCIIIDDEATARVIISQLCSNIKVLKVLERISQCNSSYKILKSE